MAVEICHDARRHVAVMYCNTSDTAFGPIFTGPSCVEDAEEFIEWLRVFGKTMIPIMYLVIGDGSDPRDWEPRGLEIARNKWEERVAQLREVV